MQTLALERYFERQGVDTGVEWREGEHALRPSEIDAVMRWNASRIMALGIANA